VAVLDLSEKFELLCCVKVYFHSMGISHKQCLRSRCVNSTNTFDHLKALGLLVGR
jgi:hypothetical protein